jgi:hypothetical protein
MLLKPKVGGGEKHGGAEARERQRDGNTGALQGGQGERLTKDALDRVP